ncbi:MAG: thioredoxin domain-containing protein, partial [Nitrospirota bacterium]|nr:thioredoxin domain-containing protein [Nitrospirota bacterium]
IVLQKKHWINIGLAVIGIVIALLYSVCEESCRYLQGSIFGVKLNYLGILYMGALALSNLLKRNALFLILLSLAIGAELYLIGFQIMNSVYCSYCLSFGVVIFLLFALNFERSRKTFVTVGLFLGFILFLVLFQGTTTPVYAAVTLLPSFGNGHVQVRLYTDYFCKPCRALEPKLEPLITDLIKRDVINISFIDTPIHKETPMYAQYFLYILNEKKDFKHALRARAVLFGAAKQKITDSKKLEAFIQQKGIRFRPFDVKSTFGIFSRYLNEDTIKSTPTCIIENKGKKERFTGNNIVTALKYYFYNP